MYILSADDIGGRYYKIGISSNAESRFASIKSPFCGDAQLVARFEFPDRETARRMERVIHETSDSYRVEAKVGINNGHTEWFLLPEDEFKDTVTALFLAEKAYKANKGNEAWEYLETIVTVLKDECGIHVKTSAEGSVVHDCATAA